MKKFWTISDINERIQWLESEECEYEKEKKERLLRIIKEVKDIIEKEGKKGVWVKSVNKDFGNKGYEIKTLT